MRSNALGLLSLVVSLTTVGCLDDRPPLGDSTRAPVVYGEDDRKDYYEHPSELWKRTTRESIVAHVRTSRLDTTDPENVLFVPEETLAEDEELCEGERFADHPVISSCSATLIDVDLVLIAGHCMDASSDCRNRRFVFDYFYEAEGVLAPVSAEDVFACRQVVSIAEGGDFDHAVVQLGRPVGPPRAPVALRLDDEPLPVGTPLVVIGFPDGIPAKIDDGGVVLDPRGDDLDFFRASLDTFGGNSGSGVFLETGELVGLLVRGERDYTREGDCFIVNVVDEDGGSRGGEDITYVARALDGLCGSGWVSDLCGDTEGWCRACWADEVCPDGWICRAHPEESGVTWCAPPCMDSSECREGHLCNRDGGYCEPAKENRCMDGNVWSFNSCGRRIQLFDECSPVEICEDGECVPAAPGNACASALEIEPIDQTLSGELDGTFTHEYRGSCAGNGRELVFHFTIEAELEVTIEAWGFDTVLYARTICEDGDSELACNDDHDPPGSRGSHLVLSLEPGEYFLFLDTFGGSAGEYDLSLDFHDDEELDGGPSTDADTDVEDADSDFADADAESIDGDADLDSDLDDILDSDYDLDADYEVDADEVPADAGADGDVDADADADADADDADPVVDDDSGTWERDVRGGCDGCSPLPSSPRLSLLLRLLIG